MNVSAQLLRQRELLRLEYEAERDEFRQQTEQIGVRRKVKRGDAWFPVSIGRNYYNSLNQYCVEIWRAEGETEQEHNFEPGRPVTFFRSDDQARLHYFNIQGVVNYADAERMVVALPENTSIIDVEGRVGVQLYFDETSYRTMMDALDRTINARNGRLAYLRDLFYSPSMEPQSFGFDDVKLPWLNPSQERAVNEVLRAKDVHVVHGPPGTGKTTTLVEAINETLMREPQVLVCAQSNMAVDWICEKLVERGINVLRIGNPTRVTDEMLSYTYERRFESHPEYHQLWSIRQTIRQLYKNRKRGDHSFHQKIERLKERATGIEVRINQELFGESRVVASTLVGSAQRILQGMRFSTLFIDEAAQALEAACWIPIRKVGRVILAGDHCQLPPTVKSYEALKGGLGKTLMERIVERDAQRKPSVPSVVTMLTVQYRMHNDIMRFSSQYFYDNKVSSSPTVSNRGILDWDLPMVWVDSTDEKEDFVGENFGRINRAEADLTLLQLEGYFRKIGKERILHERIDVGIISPYRAQVQLLRSMIKKNEFFKPFRHVISVNTVDGFQGQERDIVLISLVRSNEKGEIGFLRDIRRMNVAITRARMKLIIFGNATTITRHPFYGKLYEYVESLNKIDETAVEL